MRSSKVLSSIFLTGLVLTQTTAQPSKTLSNRETQYTLIKAARLLDTQSGKFLEKPAVLVKEDKIIALNPTKLPKNTKTIALPNQTLLPGLIDMHVHLSMNLDKDFKMRMVTDGPSLKALRAAHNGMTTLNAGYTTVRDVGVYMAGKDSLPVNIALSKSIDDGLTIGPRIIPAGHFISITGGHGDITGFAPDVRELNYRHGIANGVPDVMKAVRYQIKHGATIIKFMATGGVISQEGGVPNTPQFSLEEMKAICDTAHRVGLKCAAHAEALKGAMMALQAGVDTLEHGFQLSDDAIQLMKNNGVYLVPTLLTVYLQDLYLPLNEMPENIKQKGFDLKSKAIASFKKALKANVKIIAGTDCGISRQGHNAKELALYVENGMPPLQAIQAGTITAAEALGSFVLKNQKIAQLKPGYQADIIAVKGDPLKDIKILQKVNFVMKDGHVIKNI